MPIEYLITRLRGMRMKFLADSQISAIAGTREVNAVTSMFNASIFAEQTEKILSHRGRAITPGALDRVADETLIDIHSHTADLVRRSADSPRFAEPVFARLELEQVKYMIRHITAGEEHYERRFRFAPVFYPSGKWTINWRSIREASEFVSALAEKSHPFAGIIASIYAESDFKIALDEIELKLERWFFAKYVQHRVGAESGLLPYFADQNDIVNLHTAFALRTGPGAKIPAERFIPGPGKIKQHHFDSLVALGAADFESALTESLGFGLTPGAGSDPSLFTRDLRAAVFAKYRRKSVEQPGSIWEIVRFITETELLVANVKTALRFGQLGPAGPAEFAKYFVPRSFARVTA